MFRILHIPPSDPAIPPVDQCLHCGKDDRPLKRCSQCKMAKFCDRSCQQKAWKAGHKKCCTELAARNQEHMLPYRVRVIRHRHGAYIENPQDIPAIQAPKTKEEKVLLQKKMSELSECALDHYLSVVQHLTPDQLEQTYPLACIERWGGQGHWDQDEEERGVVALKWLLDKYDDCQQCGRDGIQFFSFCLNRPVNSNMVKHCEFCHKCFYFQPGCLRGCEHCGMGYFFDMDEEPEKLAHAAGISVEEAEKKLDSSSSRDILIRYAEDSRGCKTPRHADSFSRGMAMEGFWGW